MSGIDQRKFKELTLTRGKEKDALLFHLPTFPDRIHLAQAGAASRGHSDDPGAEADASDGAAVAWATLGLCWPSPLEVTLRSVKRDVVKYGEMVVTELRDKGYDFGELVDAGQKLYAWMLDVTFPEDGPLDQVKTEATFTDPPTEQGTGGGH